MQTKHQIEVTHQELRDICQGLEYLLRDDYAQLGHAHIVGGDLVKAKEQAGRHSALRNRLSDQEFDIWKRELDDAHIKADAEEAARYADAEPEEIQ